MLALPILLLVYKMLFEIILQTLRVMNNEMQSHDVMVFIFVLYQVSLLCVASWRLTLLLGYDFMDSPKLRGHSSFYHTLIHLTIKQASLRRRYAAI